MSLENAIEKLADAIYKLADAKNGGAVESPKAEKAEKPKSEKVIDDNPKVKKPKADDFEEHGAADVEPDAVKLALTSMAKEHGRPAVMEIMKRYKIKLLKEVDNLSPEQLAALLKETL